MMLGAKSEEEMARSCRSMKLLEMDTEEKIYPGEDDFTHLTLLC